tara:strand:+ start:15603 stop:15956 length:354 start_codon:yes stop_codon:yes gene_type:complete
MRSNNIDTKREEVVAQLGPRVQRSKFQQAGRYKDEAKKADEEYEVHVYRLRNPITNEPKSGFREESGSKAPQSLKRRASNWFLYILLVIAIIFAIKGLVKLVMYILVIIGIVMAIRR